MTLEPPANVYYNEWRYMFHAASPAGPHVVFSGSLDMAQLLQGDPDDAQWHEEETHIVVGPYWKSVTEVVPFVTITGFWNDNADEDDEQGWAISDLTWDAVSGTGAYDEEERIRLKFLLAAKGENSYIFYLAYQVFARGRELGHEGLGSPGPVWPLSGGA